jgi:hypothetical protein
VFDYTRVMDRGQAGEVLDGVREQLTSLGRALAAGGHDLSPEDAFELAGRAQKVANAADGLVALSGAWGARVETTMWESRRWERVHPVGYVDAMAGSSVALEAGLTDGLAGRKVALGAALRERFPAVLDLVVCGDLPAQTAHKVVDACAGLDAEACARVDAALAPRLVALDPARVAGEARRVAARVAPAQVEAHIATRRQTRTVEVSPADDGLTSWYALLPTTTSAAAWSAVDTLAADYRAADPDLTVAESRADAFGDLLLRNVTVSASVTLGLPVVTGVESPEPVATERVRVDRHDDETVVDAFTGEETRIADLHPSSREQLSWVEVSPATDADLTCVVAPVGTGLAVSGTHLAGLGWVSATTLAGLLRSVPLDVSRAVLEADTGTLVSHTSTAYRPPTSLAEFVRLRDGTCRMWGCNRRAEHADLDHTRPWPGGPTCPLNLAVLCRRHHRMKQQGRWRYTLAPDGTVTWIGPAGRVRVTEPQHRLSPPRAPAPPTASTPGTPRIPASTPGPPPF